VAAAVQFEEGGAPTLEDQRQIEKRKVRNDRLYNLRWPCWSVTCKQIFRESDACEQLSGELAAQLHRIRIKQEEEFTDGISQTYESTTALL
jgi:hypothetical protein